MMKIHDKNNHTSKQNYNTSTNNIMQDLNQYSKTQSSHTEEELKQILSYQYYNYISLLRSTQNFSKDPQIYINFDLSKYNNKIAIIGTLTQLKRQESQNMMYPSIVTTINQNLFQKYDNKATHLKNSKPIKRKLILSFDSYKKKWLVPFNKIMNVCNKEKALFIFTHLKILLKDQQAIYFGLTNQSYTLQIYNQYYRSVFRPMQLSLDYNYSQLKLNKIIGQDYPKNTKFLFQEIKRKVDQNMNQVVFLGILYKISIEQKDQPNQNFQKNGQLILQVIQDVYSQKSSQVGKCKIYVKYELQDQKAIFAYLKQGFIYAFQIKDIVLSQSLFISYRLADWKNKCRRISQKIQQKNIVLQNLFNKMKISRLSSLTNPYIMRNYYKFKITNYLIKIIRAQTLCQKCQSSIYMTHDNHTICKRQCGRVEGRLQLWAQIIVKDQSFTAQLNIQNQNLLDYFNLHQQSLTIKDEIIKIQTNQGYKGINLYNNTKERQNIKYTQLNDGFIYQDNQYISKFVDRLLYMFVQKTIIAIPTIKKSENIFNTSKDIKMEAQSSFINQKDLLKKNKIFLNGYAKNYGDKDHYIPYLKVQKVLD